MIFTNDFFATGSTLPNDDLVQLVDSNTSENVNYKKINAWYYDVGPVIADGIIIRKRYDIPTGTYEYYALTSFLSGKPINIELFGAKGNSRTDDTLAFINAAKFVNGLPDFVSVDINDSNENWSLEKQSVTIVGNSPIGYKILDTIKFEKPVNFLVDTIFYRGEKNKAALIFQNSHKNVIDTNVTAKPGAEFTSEDYIGVWIQGAAYSKIKVGASFFTKGIVCEANKVPGLFEGFAWNDIELKSLQSNLESFVIRNTNDGWANANRVTGGEFGSFRGQINESQPINRKRAFIKFEKDGLSSGCNSWLFLNQSFEGKLLGINENELVETLCFDFSAAPCYGISIVEPRIENVNDNRAGIFHTGSQFEFKSNQYTSVTDFTDQNNIRYIGENPIVLLDENLNDDFKINRMINNYRHTYVKKLEPYNDRTGLFPDAYYANRFCQIFKINSHNTRLWVKWYRKSEIVLFDENKDIINDLTKLTQQISLFDYRPQDYYIPDNGPALTNKTILIGNESNSDFVNSMTFIEEAKYVGIIQQPYPNSRLKVMLNQNDKGKIEKVKFLGVATDTYPTINNPSDMARFSFNTGEKFYDYTTFQTSVIKKSGVNAAVSGYTVDTVAGSRKFIINTGAINEIAEGHLFYLTANGGNRFFRITELNGNIITTDLPSDVTLSGTAITFPVCTFETY
ncbi:hypothetical protein [Chryseobacterium takakiae]|uniref:Uncharacterized protein n=1 Tax=Chryseobacterium takakiae TaxID=1302685 RepID=A0A1M4YTU9_9FLAO|nr:hypothetical protein [Chryseobacterium takakiae]SHF09190.1 hypothetical protein SAMN05444408_108217 [Chryseobacterium takakiae]